MLKAVYYPHTTVHDEDFLKHALLYWDEIEFISPFRGFNLLPRYFEYQTRELAQFLTPHVPTRDEKERAHEQIMALIKDDLPEWLKIDRQAEGQERNTYAMFRDKLLPETWQELKVRGAVQFRRHGDLDDYVSHTYLGLTMMAILAQCCAGQFTHTITDRRGAYESFLKNQEHVIGTEAFTDPQSQALLRHWASVLGISSTQKTDARRAQLISITLDVIGAETLSIESLVQLRTTKKLFAAQLRKNYSEAVEKYATKLSAEGLTETDIKGLREDFRNAMTDDLAKLNHELGLEAGRAVLSPEMAVAVAAPIVGAAALTATGVGLAMGATIAVGALLRLGVEYRQAKEEVMGKDHPMAFLYLAKTHPVY